MSAKNINFSNQCTDNNIDTHSTSFQLNVFHSFILMTIGTAVSRWRHQNYLSTHIDLSRKQIKCKIAQAHFILKVFSLLNSHLSWKACLELLSMVLLLPHDIYLVSKPLTASGFGTKSICVSMWLIISPERHTPLAKRAYRWTHQQPGCLSLGPLSSRRCPAAPSSAQESALGTGESWRLGHRRRVSVQRSSCINPASTLSTERLRCKRLSAIVSGRVTAAVSMTHKTAQKPQYVTET